MKKKKIDFFIAASTDFEKFNYDMAYFSGYGGVGALIVPKNGWPFLIVPEMEAKRAKRGRIRVYSSKKVRLFEFVKEKVKQKGIKSNRIGVNKEEFTLLLKDSLKKWFKKSRLVDLRKELYKIREQKTKEEIKIIRKGCEISDGILKNCFRDFKRFKTEAEAKAFLENETKKKGCEIAFPTIVASGVNSSEVHHSTEDTGLKKGFCVIDFGIRHKGYCTDTTRTIYLGKPTKKEIEIYNFLLGVQIDAVKNAGLNVRCGKIFDRVKKNLGKYAKYFTHGLGHGFGVRVHELPNLTEKSKDRIKENSVFTIEPGIYLKEFGIRIEDDILVMKNEPEILTKISKKLTTIQQWRKDHGKV